MTQTLVEPGPFSRSRPAVAHITSLDGFRGLAVLLVVLTHYLPHRGLGSFAWIASIGWTGVDAFLVLSAYLITSILWRQRGTDHFFGNFYMRRALRLFPLYYFILLLLVALTPVLHIRWRLGDLPFFFYATNIVLPWDQSLGGMGPFNFRHLWTLALEEQFYLIWPWLVGSRLSRKALIRICLAGIGIALFLRVLLVEHHFNAWFLYESLPTRMDSLLAGALLALIPVPSARTAWIGFAGMVAAAGALILYADTAWYTSRPMMTVGYSLLAGLYASLLALALQPRGVVARALSFGPLRFFGRYSYGLYLWHYIFSSQFDAMSAWMARTIPAAAAASLLTFAVSLMFSTAIAVLSYQVIEQPFLRLKRRYER